MSASGQWNMQDRVSAVLAQVWDECRKPESIEGYLRRDALGGHVYRIPGSPCDMVAYKGLSQWAWTDRQEAGR